VKNWSARCIVLQVTAIIFAFAIIDELETKPLRVSAVLLHELGHAGMAKACGCEVESVGITPEEESGYMKHSGNPSVAVAVVGYLAPAVVGALLLVGSRQRSLGRSVCALIGVFLVAATFLPLDASAVIYVRCIIAAVIATFLLAMLAWWMVAVILRLVGTYWCLYAFFDMLNDCILGGSEDVGDPVDIANALGVDIRIVSVFIFLAVLTIVVVAMVQSVRGDPQRSPFF